MKILTLKRVVGLAAIGGLAYAHKQRGGQWTLDSIKSSLGDLWAQANTKLGPMKDELRDSFERVASETAARSGIASEPRSYTYAKPTDDNNRH